MTCGAIGLFYSPAEGYIVPTQMYRQFLNSNQYAYFYLCHYL